MAKRESFAPPTDIVAKRIDSLSPPSDIVKAIHDTNEIVRNAVTALDARINEFQAYLAKLPGRLPAECSTEHPDNDARNELPMRLVLRLSRAGKDWELMHGTCAFARRSLGIDWQPLSKAPLRIKMAAVRMFPELLSAIFRSQTVLALEIARVVESYDAFAKHASISCSHDPIHPLLNAIADAQNNELRHRVHIAHVSGDSSCIRNVNNTDFPQDEIAEYIATLDHVATGHQRLSTQLRTQEGK